MQAPRPLRRQITRFQEDPASLRNATILTIAVTVAVVILGSVVIWLFGGKQYPDFGTAVWFTLQTITTVGYGDVTPDTGFGRFVAGVVMIVAIGFTTIVTALITSTFVDAAQRHRREQGEADERRRDERLHARITELAERLASIEDRLEALSGSRPSRESTDSEVDPPVS
ncbi:MAG TPA: potassium channel family protein [Candidatus Limnocylindrales bacterium]|nr:potassium channel family protein [Candidatus Limnocylindrales bacterium]